MMAKRGRKINPTTRDKSGEWVKGSGFPTAEQDPEFHKKKLAAKKAAEEKRKRLHKRQQYWAEQVSLYLETTPDAGLDTLRYIDEMLASDKLNDKNRIDLLKMRNGILGLNAPTAKTDETPVLDPKQKAEEDLEVLRSMGIDVKNVNVLEDGSVVSSEEEDSSSKKDV